MWIVGLTSQHNRLQENLCPGGHVDVTQLKITAHLINATSAQNETWRH